MSETQQQDSPAGAPRWMKILLVASLGLNLLVLGAGIGAALKGGDKWHGVSQRPGNVGAFTRALAEEDRAVLKRRMIREFRTGREGRNAFRAEMTSLLEALRAESVDVQDLRARMARVRGMVDTRLETAQGILVDYWADMSVEARRAYADRLEAEMRRKRR